MMTECALVLFDKAEQPGQLKQKGRFGSFVQRAAVYLQELLFKRGVFKTTLGAKLFCWLIRENLNNANKTLDLMENVRLQLITLPFPQEKLSGLDSGMVEGLIRDNLKRNGIERCYVPAFLKAKGYFNAFDCCPDYGKMLMKILLGRILKEIYSKGKRKPGDLDIVITAGEDAVEALTAIRLIEPQIRYVTLAVPQKEAVESDAEDLFGDLGLSISVVSDYKGALKNADLVINCADQGGIGQKVKLPAHALVINASGSEMSKWFPENSILNAIITGLPRNVPFTDREILQYYSRDEIAALAVAAVLQIDPASPYEFENSRRMAAEFERIGFRVEGFRGRHGTVKKDYLQNLANDAS